MCAVDLFVCDAPSAGDYGLLTTLFTRHLFCCCWWCSGLFGLEAVKPVDVDPVERQKVRVFNTCLVVLAARTANGLEILAFRDASVLHVGIAGFG